MDSEAAALLDQQSGQLTSGKLESHHKRSKDKKVNTYGDWQDGAGSSFEGQSSFGDSGGASRFFYVAKASRSDREEGNIHPTVKPTDLMRWLCRLITPPRGGIVLDAFMGSGTTGVAALEEKFRFVGIEREAAYYEIAKRRIAAPAGPLFSFDEHSESSDATTTAE